MTFIEEMEELVDKYGLVVLLDTLAIVCSEKADHLRSNWQDKASAKTWEKRAKVIWATASKLDS